MTPRYDLAIAGAGMVGVSTALWARSRGRRVLLMDGNPPGSGASSGNAGTIATYACIPVNSPALLRRLPSLLFDSDSPLGIDAGYALMHLPWLLRFLGNCRRARVDAITGHLAKLLDHADAGLNPLIEMAGAGDLMVNNGCLYLYSDAASFDAAARDNERRARHGVDFEIIDAAAVRRLEPALRAPVHRGLLFGDARHVRDPAALVQRLFERYVADGGEWLALDARRVVPGDDDVTVFLADGSTRSAGHLVVAAGAHSKSIAGAGTGSIPLDTERGHHVMFARHGDRVSRPVGWADAGLYATPMTMGLRVAGTVEIAGTSKPRSPARIAYLARKADELLGDLGPPDGEWLGFRPTLPDALPVIGPSPVSRRVLLAFGHQHVGLTLGGITGRIVADLAEGRAPNLDISAYAPGRF